MILRTTQLEVVGPTSISVTFNDGERGVADVGLLLHGPIFEPLHDAETFARAHLDTVAGTITWPNGADLAPEAVHELLSRVHAASR